jgi:hypothetical protein
MLHDLLLLAISKSGLDQPLQGFRVEGLAQERDGASRAGPYPCLLVATRGHAVVPGRSDRRNASAVANVATGDPTDRKSPASAGRIDALSSATDMSSAWGLMGDTVSGPERFA